MSLPVTALDVELFGLQVTVPQLQFKLKWAFIDSRDSKYRRCMDPEMQAVLLDLSFLLTRLLSLPLPRSLLKRSKEGHKHKQL